MSRFLLTPFFLSAPEFPIKIMNSFVPFFFPCSRHTRSACAAGLVSAQGGKFFVPPFFPPLSRPPPDFFFFFGIYGKWVCLAYSPYMLFFFQPHFAEQLILRFQLHFHWGGTGCQEMTLFFPKPSSLVHDSGAQRDYSPLPPFLVSLRFRHAS